MKKKICEAINGIKLVHICGEIPPDFWEEFPHSHEHCEVFLHICGKLDIFVEHSLYHLNGGEVRVYRTDELHCGKTSNTQYMEWFQLSLPRAFFDRDENRILGKVILDRAAGEGNVFIPERYDEAVSVLREAIEVEGEFSKHYCYAAVLRLLCIINEEKHTSVSITKKDVLKKFTDAIDVNYKSISSVKDLGQLTHYSTCYINKVFREELNVTPYKFILAKKLNESKNALKKGMSITDACEYAGFNDYANFITLFKKHFGITPKKWIMTYTYSKT